MKITALFGQRKCEYDGQYLPELIRAADEYTMDENPDDIDEAMQDAIDSEEYSRVELITIKLDTLSTQAIHDRLNKPLEIKGAVV